ncbi:hypothetical protein SKAU_G00114620 [Synaphobranchus kaupii]|uniref:Ig-like domain-containing protein n=1 Tax=Synaphobranchus kaupii TaxID=118154 RepID=A0A9Q1J1E9_SYNKA|nr:hypothetical protein SKAU_G00114620 [Synaphobranchus kaupii]
MGSLGQTAVILGLCSLLTVAWGLVLGRPILHAPNISLVGYIEEFYCIVPNAPKKVAILYVLQQENQPKAFGEYTAYDGNQVNFPLKVKRDYDGNFFCMASVQNSSAVPATISDVHYFRVIEPVEGVELVSDPPSAEVFVGRGLTLTCIVRKGTHISYQWSHNGTPTAISASRQYLKQATLEDAGNYSCLARNQLNDTQVYSVSSHTFVRVKVPVSKPEISLTVRKDNDVYLIGVICSSDTGTPPVNFTFTVQNKTGRRLIFQRRDTLSASLTVPVALNRDEGQVQCQATNGDGPVDSEKLTLKVVPVGGAVTLTSESVRRYFDVVGLKLHCAVERGTFPRFDWFLNNSSLGEKEDFDIIGKDGQTLLLTTITARSSGFYHCEATDSFGINGIKSEKLFIDEKALEHVSAAAFAVVLSCFLFLVCLVTGCCVYGVIYRRRLPSVKPRPTFLSTEKDSLESEDEEPVEKEYMDDVELVNAAKIAYTEEGEVESVDEWPEIERALQISCMDESIERSDPPEH